MLGWIIAPIRAILKVGSEFIWLQRLDLLLFLLDDLRL